MPHIIADCFSFSNPSIYPYSLLFYPPLEIKGWFQSVVAEWLITVEDRGGCSSYQYHFYSVNSAAPQFASFLSFLPSFLCVFIFVPFPTFWNCRLSSTFPHLQLFCITYSVFVLWCNSPVPVLTPGNCWCTQQPGIYNSNAGNTLIRLHTIYKTVFLSLLKCTGFVCISKSPDEEFRR